MEELEVMGLAQFPHYGLLLTYGEILTNDVLSSALFHLHLLGFCIWGFVVTCLVTKA
jgi:hypothetical protein